MPTWDFTISSKEDSTDSLSNLSNQCFTILTEVFPCVHMRFLCFNLCSFPLFLSWSTTEMSLSPSSLFLPIRYLYTLMRSHLNLLFSRVNSLSSPNLSSYEKCSSPLFVFVVLHFTLHGLGSQEWDAVLQVSLGFPNPISASSDNNSVLLLGHPSLIPSLVHLFLLSEFTKDVLAFP